jgi:hypothetical protein
MRPFQEIFPQDQWLDKVESMMRVSLAELLCDAVTELQLFYGNDTKIPMNQLLNRMEKYPAQLVTLAVQVAWTSSVESALEKSQAPEGPLDPPCRRRAEGIESGYTAQVRAFDHGTRASTRRHSHTGFSAHLRHERVYLASPNAILP